MTAVDSSPCWYTRRAGVVRGPFTATEVSRYILLGRIQLDDALRGGGADWVAVADCAALIPDELKVLATPQNQARLLAAQRTADERQPGDRRSRNADPPAHIMERRSGIERRQADPATVVRFRATGVGDGSPVTAPAQPLARHHKLVIGVAMVLGVVLLVWASTSAG